MTYTIKTVHYPQMAIEILTEALQCGELTMEEIRQVLDKVSNRSHAEGYLNYCLQTRILRQSRSNPYIKGDKFLPTVRGRQIFLQSKQDKGIALRSLLGSIPYYRFHVELSLAWLLIDTDFHYPNQTKSMWATIRRLIPL